MEGTGNICGGKMDYGGEGEAGGGEIKKGRRREEGRKDEQEMGGKNGRGETIIDWKVD